MEPATRTRRKPWAIVLAGGDGTRLAAVTEAWEGRAIPKQFASYGTRRTFLQRTMDRVGALVPAARTVVVVPARHLDLASEQLAGFDGVEIVAQPAGRGTLPGVLLPLAHVTARDPDALVAVFPSDHHIRHARPFRRAFRQAVAAAAAGAGGVVLVGAAAERPATDLGWILPGATRAGAAARAAARSHGRRVERHAERPLDRQVERHVERHVERFVEKPAEDLARALLAEGALWNTLIVAATARALRALVREHLPDLGARFDAYRPAPARPAAAPDHRALEALYADMPRADLSRDLLERARGLGVVEMVGAGWSDCGTPEQLAASLAVLR